MWIAITSISGLFCLVLALVILLSKKNATVGQLEALKQELERSAKSREYACKIINKVDSMSDDDIKRRLQELSNK